MTYPPVPGGWQDPTGSPGNQPAQPTYLDPISGQPTYIDPASGQPAYIDPAAGQQPTYVDPASGQPASPAVGYPASGQGYPGQPGYQAPGYQDPRYQAPGYQTADYQAPSYPQSTYPAYPGYTTPAIMAAPRTNGMAIASMVVSIVGAALLLCYGGGALLGLLGAILGHVAKRQVNTRGEGGGGMALAGIIIGWIVLGIGLIIVALFVLLFVWAANQPTYSDYSFR